MREKLNKLFILLFAVAMMLHTIFFGFQVAQFSDTMSIKYQQGGLSSAQIDAVNTKGKASFPYVTGWNQAEDIMIENTSIGSRQKVTLLEIYGNMTAVYPCPLLSGSYIEKSDRKGCVISRKTAERLFQSNQVIGCLITLEKKQYIIKGILDSSEAVMIIQKERSSPFPFLEFQYRNKRHPASNTKSMLLQLGLPDYESFTEGNFYGGVAYLLIGFPFLLFLILIFFPVKNFLPSKNTSLWNFFKWIVISGILLLFLLFFTKYCVVFSDDFIPSRMSDFAFWPSKFQELKMEYRGVLSNQMFYKESILIHNLKYAFLSSLLSSFLLLTAKYYNPFH